MPRLKHLDLQGYKTFATKSQFVLGDGITAIVGPNGSGKSNIADSIRWVLGEQSFALLRGKKTEDMIFAGSELRPRASMAQAALTFDNADGWLPIDFAEVTITRRAYRDGENEYLLNGQRVRLRDVAELLARCGLAERTYTIIGQGLVDAALSLKAEERRALFEEAAGIGVYRDKREDALRRLEQTGHNLERVHDILSEIRPRLRALERQSARARDYAQVKADLDELLKVWYGFHWHEAQRTLTEARASAETRTEELAGVQMEQETLDKEVLDVRAKISVLRGQINRQITDTNRLRAERESLSRDLAVADERLRLFAAQREEAMGELGPLDAELAEAERRVEAARADLNRLQSERDEAGREAETASQAIASGEAERRTLTAQEAAARANAQALSTRIAERTFHREQIERRRAQIAAAKTEASDSLAAAEAKADELRLARDERTETLARIRGERNLANSQLLELTQKISVAESRLTGLSNAAAAARAEAERLAARQQALEQARADLGAFASGAKTLLAAAREGRLTGSARAIAALLRVPREYEIAIAAALGAQLDAIVVEDLNAADHALALLESEGGRAALVPLDKLAHVEPIVAPPDLEIVGVASALVECDTPLRPAVEILLARTIVVRAREAARRLLDAIPADARLVTLSGEVYSPSGTIVGGRDAGPAALAGAREWRELADTLHGAQSDRDALEADRRALEVESHALHEARTRISARLAQTEAAEREAVEARDQAALEHERAMQEANWRRDQFNELESEAVALDRDEAARTMEMSALAEARTAAEAEAENAARRRAERAEADRGLAERLAALQTAAAVAGRAAGDAATRVAEIERARVGAESLVNAKRFRAATFAADAGSIEASVAERRKRAAAIDAELARLAAELDPAQERLAELEAAQADVESGEGRARTSLHTAERLHAEAQLALARKREDIETLRRRIEEDFGLVELEYSEEVTGPTPLPLGALVARLSPVEALPEGIEDAIQRRRVQLRRMGAINPEAPTEYDEVKERHEFLTTQVKDLETAAAQLREVVAEMDLMMEREFRKTFDAVAEQFRETFTRLFGGGTAKLILTDPDHLTTSGIDIVARLPGRRQQGLALLSGGERSLTACALIFALLRVSPTPFCVLDEVDAMLDEANVGRFREMLVELCARTQFIVITHNRNTVEAADTVYGISMGADSASQVVSLKLEGEKISEA